VSLVAILAFSAALVSAASWAVGTILFRRIGEQASPLGMNLGKDLIGLPLLGIALLAVGTDPVDARSVGLMLLSGLVGIAVGDTLFFMALMRLDPRVTLVLAVVGQVFTVLGAVVLLGERPEPIVWVGIVMVLGGVALVLREQNDLDSPESRQRRRGGVLLGLGAALCFAAAALLAKLGVETTSALQGTTVRLAGGVAGLLLLGTLRGQTRDWLRPFRDPSLLRSIVVAEFVIIFGGFWLGLFALKHLDVSTATILTSTEPLFVLPLAAWMLKERITRRGGLGAAVAVTGVAMIILA